MLFKNLVIILNPVGRRRGVRNGMGPISQEVVDKIEPVFNFVIQPEQRL